MVISVTGQLYLFLLCFFIGMICALLFDMFRALRRSFWIESYWIYITDILFWILVTFLVLCLLYNVNGVEVRGFMGVGIALGSMVYLIGISKWLLIMMIHTTKVVYQTVKGILLIGLFPLRLFSFTGKKIFIFFYRPTRKLFTTIKKNVCIKVFLKKRHKKVKKNNKKIKKKL